MERTFLLINHLLENMDLIFRGTPCVSLLTRQHWLGTQNDLKVYVRKVFEILSQSLNFVFSYWNTLRDGKKWKITGISSLKNEKHFTETLKKKIWDRLLQNWASFRLVPKEDRLIKT